MSFYGNSYFYKSNLFSEAKLSNPGINNHQVSPSLGFSIIDEGDTITLDSSVSNNFNITAGNRWINFAY